MKKLFTLFILLLLAGCTAPQIDLEEVTDESAVEELPDILTNEEEEEITENTAPYYNFTEGQTQEILGHEITVIKINPNPILDIIVDGKENTLKETKNEELIEDLKIQMYYIHDIYLQEKYVTLKVEKLELEDNEYILRKDEKITIGDKDIVLEQSKTNGYIQISVYNKGTVIGDTQDIKRGSSLEINGVTITNIKNYYKVEQYVRVIIE